MTNFVSEKIELEASILEALGLLDHPITMDARMPIVVHVERYLREGEAGKLDDVFKKFNLNPTPVEPS